MKAGVEVGKRKPILVFEQKVLHAIEEEKRTITLIVLGLNE
jgi:hypothetical protein